MESEKSADVVPDPIVNKRRRWSMVINITVAIIGIVLYVVLRGLGFSLNWGFLVLMSCFALVGLSDATFPSRPHISRSLRLGSFCCLLVYILLIFWDVSRRP